MPYDVQVLASRKHDMLVNAVISMADRMAKPMGPGNKCRDDSPGCGTGVPSGPTIVNLGPASRA
jgi:hypothetical protein